MERLFANLALSAFSGAAFLAVAASFTNSAKATPSLCDTISGNLVQNCGFEGNPSGQPIDWTFTPAAVGSDSLIVSGGGPTVHTGNNAYNFAGVGSEYDQLSQAISTTAGDQYQISFWVQPNGNSDTSLFAAFGGNTLVTLTDPAALSDPANNNYEQLTFDEIASTTGTENLVFGGYDGPGNIYLDDAVVIDEGKPSTPVPAPGGWPAVAGGLALAALTKSGRQFLARLAR